MGFIMIISIHVYNVLFIIFTPFYIPPPHRPFPLPNQFPIYFHALVFVNQ